MPMLIHAGSRPHSAATSHREQVALLVQGQHIEPEDGGPDKADATAADLISGMARKELFLAFQPQFTVDGADYKLCGAEALIRWNHPRRGLLLPGQFLPEVGALGLQCELGTYVLQCAIEQIQDWLDKVGWSPRVAVNLTARQLGCPALSKQVLGTLSVGGVATRYIELEILESEAIEDTESAARELVTMSEAGVSVAVDDFGTGFASLQYLLQYPIDAIKICSTFVHGIGRVDGSDEICRAIIQLGHALGKRVIAEGVETLTQLAFLRDNGCPVMQGFLLGRPISGAAFSGFHMKARTPMSV